MPPRVNSRYFKVRGARDENEKLFLKERKPLNPDVIFDGSETPHVVVEGESLAKIAYKYFDPINEPADITDPRGAEHLHWILADLNGIADMTIDLKPGRIIYVPSQRVVNEKILNR